MEPLIATDWLKDYDPLFDLFDEEMRAGHHHHHHQHQHHHNHYSSCSNSAYNNNSYQQAAPTTMADLYFNEYDLNNYCYTPLKQHMDELSLILGDYLPYLELDTAGNISLGLNAPLINNNGTCGHQGSNIKSPIITATTIAASATSTATTPATTPTMLSPTSTGDSHHTHSNNTLKTLGGHHNHNSNHRHNHHHHHHSNNTSTTTTNANSNLNKRRKKSLRMKGTSLLAKQPLANLTKSDSAKRYCVILEHAYASVRPLY